MKNFTLLALILSSSAAMAGGTMGGNPTPTESDFARSWNGEAGKQVMNLGVRIEWFADACGTPNGVEFDKSKCPNQAVEEETETEK
ncbi:hypothetical protein [Vibrio metschnikovii]|uniref:hypothetical protein n=1 Tax=Vibrio metschnikovii TaxID=28172 RepID=UPI001C309B80|nr:hypothetical protein [Vibrio metschnikovii]